MRAIVSLVLLTACYDPKTDVDKFRARAEAKLEGMQRIGKAVTAQAPLTEDTLAFPSPARLHFDGDKPNAAVVHLEELSDIGGMHVYNRLIHDEFWRAPLSLMKTGKDPYVEKVDGALVASRFEAFVSLQYLLVLRTAVQKVATLTGSGEFEGGELRGEAFLCDMDGTCYGGFTYSGASSDSVTATTRGKDRETIDKDLALRANIEDKARRELYHKATKALAGATFRSAFL